MKTPFGSLFVLLCSFGIGPSAYAQVEYVRVCSQYGPGFNYIPGTDTCFNASTGDTRVQTQAGTWRSLLPYPEGKWVTNPQQECASAKMVKLGTFKSTDLTMNGYGRKQSQPISLPTKSGEFVSKVIMSGGFYDARIPERHGANPNGPGLCVRSTDPTVVENLPSGPANPPYGNSGLPIGCVSNSRIVNMPAAYSVAATAAYPSVDAFLTGGNQNVVNGPYSYGKYLVITTDFPSGSANLLTENGAMDGKPLAGSLSAWVCIDSGPGNSGANQDR